MNNELIKDIALIVVNDSILSNWNFYLVTIALFLISYFLGSFIKSYAKQRGEQLGRKSDVDSILTELKQTTEIATTIKSKIDKDIWILKEFNQLRRQKLEEILMLLYKYKNDMYPEVKGLINGEMVSDTIGVDRIQAIWRLYFPDLDESMTVFINAYMKYMTWKTSAIQKKLSKLDQEPDSSKRNTMMKGIIDKEDSSTFKECYKGIAFAIKGIENQARKIMENLRSI